MRGRSLPFTHAAITIGLSVFSGLVALGVLSDLTGAGWSAAGPLAWTALGMLVVALVYFFTWEREPGRTQRIESGPVNTGVFATLKGLLHGRVGIRYNLTSLAVVLSTRTQDAFLDLARA